MRDTRRTMFVVRGLIGEAPRRVRWPGAGVFWLTGSQHRVFATLVDAVLHTDSGEVPEGVLLAAARSGGGTLAEVFEGSGAWGVLVVPGSEGCYRLRDLPGQRGG